MMYSYTQIRQYLACPRRYRHRIERVEAEDPQQIQLWGCSLARQRRLRKRVARDRRDMNLKTWGPILR